MCCEAITPSARALGRRIDEESAMQGYCGRVAIVDLTSRRVDYSGLPESVLRSFIGGRGLGAAILCRHDGPSEPLAPESPLCVLAGPMTGTDFTLSNRLDFVLRLRYTAAQDVAKTRR